MTDMQNDLKILVAGECRNSLQSIFDYLEKMEIQPVYAQTGSEAIDLFSSVSPDIVLLDEKFEDMDTCTIARQIRKMERNKNWTAIILLSNLSSDFDLTHGLNSGGNDYLIKPINEIALRAKMVTVKRLIDVQRMLFDLTSKINYNRNLMQQISATKR